MRNNFIMAAFCAAFFSTTVVAASDLAIGFDRKTDRPNAFIAWRNSQRILEIELEVENHGDGQATGELSVALLDNEGRVLLSSPRSGEEVQTVTLPPRREGGEEGKIVQLRGNLAMNLLIDELDRANRPYALRVEVKTRGGDLNVLDNIAVKTFNVPSRLRPGSKQFREFAFRNDKDRAVDVTWQVSTSKVPRGWTVRTDVTPGQQIRLAAGEVVHGYICVASPKEVQEGDHVDVVVTAVDAVTREPIFRTEWFVVHDETPPELTGVGYTIDPKTGMVDVTLTANDRTSMLKEASGVRIEYSTDDGLTFSTRIMAYQAGNFVGPTRFRASLGPFQANTNLKIHAIAEDIAGNSVKRTIDPIVVIASR